MAELNPQQQQAVDAIEGPVLVIAGPGTGKTQVLAMRIANILKLTDAQPSNILCLTFTESGVAAMRKRLEEIIGPDAYQVKICTFHGFGNEVMQTFPEKFATTSNLVQLDELGKVKLMREILDNVSPDKKLELRPFNDRYYHAKGIAGAIHTLKGEDVSPEQLREVAQQDLEVLSDQESSGMTKLAYNNAVKSARRNLEVADYYAEYERLVAEKGYYDYDDMIRKVIRRLQEDDELLAYYQERFLYILVDEYQDTNRSQNEIITILGSFDGSPNIFAVGDDDQAIYRFQGANVANLLYFRDKFIGTQIIPISTSYRSNQPILDLAQSLISHNKQRMVNLVEDLQKNLTSGAKVANYKPEVYEFATGLSETQFVVSKIQELVKAGASYQDCAILYHHHIDAEEIIEALLRANIPIQLSAGRNALREQPVQMLLQLLTAVAYTDKNRDRSLFKVLYYGFLGLNKVDVFKVTHYAGDKRKSIFNVISDTTELMSAGVANVDPFLKFVEKMAAWSQLAAETSLIRFIEHVGADSGLINQVFTEGAVRMEEINGVHSFYNFARLQNRIKPNLTLEELLADIELMENDGLNVNEQELDITNKGVHLMTAHSSKGLEFQNVFIIKMHSAKWGNKSRHGSSIKLPKSLLTLEQNVDDSDSADTELEDQRRLLFVAITRAKERLFLSYALKYENGDSSREVGPSVFIAEMDPEVYVQGNPDAYSTTTAAELKLGVEPLPQLNQEAEERVYLQTLADNFRLSATALNAYIKCPVNFKYTYILKVPEGQTEASLLGTAIHKGMEEFYKPVIAGGQPSKELMISALKANLQDKLLGSEERKKYIDEGVRLMEAYYDYYSQNGGFATPIAVECDFTSKNIVLQQPGMEPIALVGKLDRIDWIDKSIGTVKVVDYKTGAQKTAGDIMGTTKSGDGSVWRQLVFYRLLGDLDPFFRPLTGASKYSIVEAEVDFIKADSTTSKFRRERFEITKADVDELIIKIAEVTKHIRALEFGTNSDYPPCGECEFCKMLNLE